MKKRVKRTFSIHHWIGLVAGLLLLISSITGSVLVFHHDIDHAQFSNWNTLGKPATGISIDSSFEPIRQSYSDYDIRIPDFPETSSQALKYELRKGNTRKWIFVHPMTGEVIGKVEQADQRLVHILLELHYMLMSGTFGKVVVLLMGIALMVLSITGILLYRRSILKVLSFRQKISLVSRRSFFSSLHRIVGVWSLIFNLFIGITGTYISFTLVQSAISSGGNLKMESPALSISIDATLDQVRKEYPAFDINYLLFPKNVNGNLTISGRLKSDPSWYGFTNSKIQVNPRTGIIEAATFLQDTPWHNRFVAILKPIHFGDYAGIGIKLLYCFFGIFPAILAISGFLIWRLRSVKQPVPEHKHLAKPFASSSSI